MPVNSVGIKQFEAIPHYTGLKGKILGLFGAIRVYDPATKEDYFIKMGDLAQALVGRDTKLSKKSEALIEQRIWEITAPHTLRVALKEKIEQLFDRYYEDKSLAPESFKTTSTIIEELEKIKLDLSDIKPLYYENSLLEVVKNLQPGDIIAKKYHEDNFNPICLAQQIFSKEGYREASKFSHLALFLGEINGEYWIAEATIPHGGEAQIRRIRLDDSRFGLIEKNQYLVIRPKNLDVAKETARLGKKYTIKLLPTTEQKTTQADIEGQLKYGMIEAARSLWHSAHLGHFGKHRIFKYYSDYKNGVAFEYLGNKRTFFCSQFAMLMESLSELNNNKEFQTFIEKHPVPLKYDENKTGIALKLSKLWYSIRKGVWSRVMTIKYGDEIEKLVQTKLDPLRTNPQEAIIYMMDHKDQYEAVGLITHRSDFIK
ncbi:MAG: hypothetical protein K2X39_05950 [Silvanigrellaceae bacterium]|nr:hypothetical protein [Silvanigrellaceae bacterium]